MLSILVTGALLMGFTSAGEISQLQINEIVEKCQLPEATLELETPKQVILKPNMAMDDGAMECLLDEIRRFPEVSFGFPGNEVSQLDENGTPIKEGDESN